MQVKGELFFTSDKQSIYFNAQQEGTDYATRFPWQVLANSGLLQDFIQELGLVRQNSGRGMFCYRLDTDERSLAGWFEDRPGCSMSRS